MKAYDCERSIVDSLSGLRERTNGATCYGDDVSCMSRVRTLTRCAVWQASACWTAR